MRVCAAVAIHDYFNAGNINEVIDRYRLDASKESPEEIFDAFFSKKYPKAGNFSDSESMELFSNGQLMIGRREFTERYSHPNCNRSCNPTGHTYIGTIVEESCRAVQRHQASMQMLDELYSFNFSDLVV